MKGRAKEERKKKRVKGERRGDEKGARDVNERNKKVLKWEGKKAKERRRG